MFSDQSSVFFYILQWASIQYSRTIDQKIAAVQLCRPQRSVHEQSIRTRPRHSSRLYAGVVADLWPNNSMIMRHFFKNNSRIMQTYNYLFVSIISFVNMNNMKITPNATMCSSIISLFLLITLFTVQL